MPNPETSPDMFAKYFDYLVKTQGIDKAKDRRLEYLKKRMIVNDSLRDDATQQRIADLDMQYNQDSTLTKKDLIIWPL